MGILYVNMGDYYLWDMVGVTMIFERKGYKPILRRNCDRTLIRECFATCKPEIKQRLEQFFIDKSQKEVTFEFEDQEVIVSRQMYD